VMLVGDLVVWFYEYLGGIAPDDANPGFKHLVMRPHPVDGLDWVNASLRSPYGLVKSEWKHDAGKFDWQFTIPPNATATVYVPAKNADAVTEGGRPANEAKDITFTRTDNGAAIYEVTSGTYHFVSE
jgi:alpha-L-rhamnosidase